MRIFFTRSEQLAHTATASGQSAARHPRGRCDSVSAVTVNRDAIRRERLLKNEQTFRDHNNRRVSFEEGTSFVLLLPRSVPAPSGTVEEATAKLEPQSQRCA